MFPCPCSYYNDPEKERTCSNSVITRYQKRNSGLMLDRIDFYTEVQRVEYDKLSDERLEEKLSGVQVRVEAARQIQRERFAAGMKHTSSSPITCNAGMRPGDIRKYCQLDETCNSLMRTAMNQMRIFARAYHRVLKLSRAITAQTWEEKIAPTHLAEVLQYRPKRMME
jgi:magnesium chelatase family protein